MASPGLILDRDGTVVFERGYLSSVADLVLIPGVSLALKRAKTAGVRIAVVTNQSAVGRGVVTEKALVLMHMHLQTLVPIDTVYYCPHLPSDNCECRKPKPEMVLRCIRELSLDPERTIVVGDNLSDCLAGAAAGLPAVLVRTGHGAVHAINAAAAGFEVAEDLEAAVERYLGRISSNGPPEDLDCR